MGDIVLVNIGEGVPESMALDPSEAGPIGGFDLRIVGSQGYEATRESDLVIITSRGPRKPGMSRKTLRWENCKRRLIA